MNHLSLPNKGLYAITPDHAESPEALAESVRLAILGGVKLVQYRAKHAQDKLSEARLLLSVCREMQTPLIINDDVDLALNIGADGVHLGREDCSLSEARKKMGPDAIIGVSCYDSIELALNAKEASYVAFGRFFPSKTKPHAPCAGIETLIEAKKQIKVPIIAIGGITPENAQPLIEAGADMLAVVDAVFGQADIQKASQKFLSLFN